MSFIEGEKASSYASLLSLQLALALSTILPLDWERLGQFVPPSHTLT